MMDSRWRGSREGAGTRRDGRPAVGRALGWMVRAAAACLFLRSTGWAGSLRAENGEGNGLAGRLARVFHSEVRDAAPRLRQIEEDLARIPGLRRDSLGSHYGYHSGTISDQQEVQWVQIDLGRSLQIDGAVAVPAHVATIETPGAGYGFPLRFKIEVSEHDSMANATVLFDRTTADVENPGWYPMVLRPEAPAQGRYVRFSSTKHAVSLEGFFWAMEELMVLAGNRNVAAGSAVSASCQLELLPNWSVAQICDGLSALGAPVSVDPSPTSGYLSAPSDRPVSEKWVTVDLGREYPVDEVRLLPAGPRTDEGVGSQGFPRTGGRAFPKDLMVELSSDPAFGELRWESQVSSEPIAFPWGCPVVRQSGGVPARYVRVRALELWPRGKTMHQFGLSEIQVYVGNQNVALGKPVSVKDRTDRPESTRWAPDYVVDGFTSQHPLVELPEYLALIERRGALEREWSALRTLRDGKVRQVAGILRVGGGGVGAAALLGWLWMLVRQKALRRRDTVRLREQIARDLHDDIGSNLGGIVLLSEMGSRHSGSAEETRRDFAAIKTAAEETADSMQDIVWLIQPGNSGLQELVLQLRTSVDRLAGGLSNSVLVVPLEFKDRRVSLPLRRHVFFAFKETLNNVRKHSGARNVEVVITISGTHLKFSVRDDGAGFDPQAVGSSRHGLVNLQRRAGRLKGTCRLETAPGHGTKVVFEAPLKS